MSRTPLAIVGLVTFLFGASGASAFTTYPVDPVITFDRQADPDRLSDFRTRRQMGNPEGRNSGYPRA